MCEVGGSRGSSALPSLSQFGKNVIARMIAAAVMNLPPITGVSSTIGGTDLLAFALGLSGTGWAAGFSLSLIGRVDSAKASRTLTPLMAVPFLHAALAFCPPFRWVISGVA